ncbi:MAG: energy-coupling factor transporter ATPase [Clostridiales bacterium]|nr:energy-coupling factor transporter ATPase [Clostridiales bacterium]
MRIEVKDLTYSYGESKALSVRALDGVSLVVEEGEFLGIIGHTGSGKTTFVQHLNGLIKLKKNCGSIKIGDFELGDKKCDFKALRASLGMVFQYPEYQLFAETVYDDVAFGVKNFMPNLPEQTVREMVKDALFTVGVDYEKIKDKSPFELSGGQKRRVAIAGVIVTKPEVLVLDEPVAGLDPVGKREFIALLHRLKKEFVKTIILVSHDMNLVAENCTKTAVFEHGKIQAVGTPAQIFSDYERIKNLGLDLPVTAFLNRELEKAGKGVQNDLTVDGFIDSVCKKFRGGTL